MTDTFADGKVVMHCGDCLDVLKTLAPDSVDACVTDPPYGLEFMGRAWDRSNNIVFRVELWAEVLRVLKPGAHLVAFGGTRTYHRMACAVENAGFEVRDQIQWLYGSGFPKSHNLGNGFGTALKPACEPIVLARKPLSEGTVATNVLRWGTGALNIDGCRVATDPSVDDARLGGNGQWNIKRESDGHTVSFPPATMASSPLGRWPANVIHDGSDEVVGAFPESGPPCGSAKKSTTQWSIASPLAQPGSNAAYVGDSGSAARFFYTAKADADDRLGSRHPTVKPLDLMQYLVRLVTPPRGLVFDPFAGTGTLGEAAWREGMRAILIEREAEYCNDICRRMKLVLGGPRERVHATMKVKQKDKPLDMGPLFGGDR